MTPDLEQARQFLELLDPGATAFTFQTFDDSEKKRRDLARVIHGRLEDVAQELIALQKRGAGIFITINETDGKGRKASNITRARAVFADLDGAPVDPVLACQLEPHVVVESSPGRYHTYWLAHRLHLNSFTAVQKGIIRRFHSDKSIHDLNRVMRLPGFSHQKDTPFQTRILQVNDRLPYEADDLLSEFYTSEAAPEEAFTQDDRKPNGHASGGDGEDRETAELVRALLTGEDLHATTLALAMRLCKSGMPDQQVLLFLKGAMAAIPHEHRGSDSRWIARYNELPRLVRGARAKLGPQPTQTAASIGYTLMCDLTPNVIVNDIVEGLISRHAFGEAHADSSGGKTTILIDLGLHIAAEIDYRGRRVVRQPVVYVAFEGHGGIDNRIIAAARERGVVDAPFALVKTSVSFKDPEIVKQIGEIAQRLSRAFGGDCPVFIIDTYTAALGAGTSDCDPKDVTAFIKNVQEHLLTIGTVIIAHHFGKDSSRGGRGWSGLRASLDFELEIDRDGDLRTMRLTKSRDGSDSQPAMCYRFHEREVGLNQYKEPVTTVVVEHLADQAAKRGKRHSPKARAAIEQLWNCITDRKRSFTMPEDPRLRCVLLADWERACIAPGVVSKSDRELDRLKQFRAAKDELQDVGAIICDGQDGNRVRPTPKEPASFGDGEL